MRAAVVTAWRSSGCPWRDTAREVTAAHWEAVGLPVFYGDRPGEFNRSAARNAAAMAALDWGAEVLFVSDADTWTPAAQVEAACALAAETGQIVRASKVLRKLTRSATERGADVQDRRATTAHHGTSCPGLAVPSSLLARVGGWDERFEGWGGEDRAFWAATVTIGGGYHDVPGNAFHLWHPASPRQRQVLRSNVALAVRYKTLAGGGRRTGIVPAVRPCQPDVAGMVALLREPGGPLGAVVASVGGG